MNSMSDLFALSQQSHSVVYQTAMDEWMRQRSLHQAMQGQQAMQGMWGGGTQSPKESELLVLLTGE